ncbi:MAG: SDR family oxidoreductase [Paludibacteraceae bacterium]|nr:SDR family oxidoreductase [Paludibacteraceae bacterium]
MKNAIVTGGTKGIGLEVAKMLLREGYFVTVTYAHDHEAVENCQAALRAEGEAFEIIRADQSDPQAIKEFVQEMRKKGHVDCLVLNAGTTHRAGLLGTSDEDWNRVMQVNVNAPMAMLRDLYDVIPSGSRIVFMGSMMGVLPHSVSLSYGVTKAAVIALAKNLVKEFDGTETTVNVIVPGFVETGWQKNKPEEIRNNICAKTALKRFAKPEEIADAVRFCLNNAFLNGSVIEVSGGYNYR